tara:strand:- start:238 stop:471 length:234 start_codon:yes stop_codon:yes gene_type:complete
VRGENELKIGDLVLYAPYYLDGEGSWMMSGDLGIVIEIKKTSDEGQQIVKVSWITDDIHPVDMHCDVLKKITRKQKL